MSEANNAPIEAVNETESQVQETDQEAAQGGEAEVSAKESTSNANAAQKAIEKQLKKIKYKVDGEMVEEELDLSNEEELAKRLSLAKAAKKRMEESAVLRKDVEKFINLLKTNPKKVLADPNIGIDVKQFAQAILQEAEEEAAKSPEQKRIEELERQLQERQEAEKTAKEQREAEEFQRMQAEAEQKYEQGFMQALESSGLPQNPYTIGKMVDIMKHAIEIGYDPTPQDVARLLRSRVEEDVKSLFATSNEDILEQLINDEVFGKVQKRRLSKSRAAAKMSTEAPKAASSAPKKESDQKIAMKDFFKI